MSLVLMKKWQENIITEGKNSSNLMEAFLYQRNYCFTVSMATNNNVALLPQSIFRFIYIEGMDEFKSFSASGSKTKRF
jgi:hypothetical protein